MSASVIPYMPRPLPLPLPPPPTSPPAPPPRIALSEHEGGSFDISIDGHVWLAAGGPVQVRSGGVTYSAGSGGGLNLINQSTDSGSDSLGLYRRTEHRWNAGSLWFTTAVRQYASAVVFEQQYDSAAAKTAGAGLSSSYPSFSLPPKSTQPHRHFLQWDGDMAGQLYKVGTWHAGAPIGGGLVGTAPLVLFSDDLSTSLVLSPFSSFMVASQHVTRPTHAPATFSYGVLSSVRDIPAGSLRNGDTGGAAAAHSRLAALASHGALCSTPPRQASRSRR